LQNFDIGFTRSHHFVAGYDKSLSRYFKMRAEVYYQYLFDIPIETRPNSSFSNINQAHLSRAYFLQTLSMKEPARNYGLELTLEKSLQQKLLSCYSRARCTAVHTKARTA
jgi:hypothetical protein